MDSNGKCIIFSAPSGAGKTTIVHHLLNQDLGLSFSISACNRGKRKNETHAEDYYFLSSEEFKKNIENNAFLEWEEVYPNQFYGTLKSEIDRIWKEGKHVIFDVDVIGGLNLKKYFGNKALSVFVKPPSIEALKKRLKSRDTETADKIGKRIAKAEFEIQYESQFDVILINDNLEEAFKKAEEITSDFLSKKHVSSLNNS